MLKSFSRVSFAVTAGCVGAIALGAVALSAYAPVPDDPDLSFDGPGLRGFASEEGLAAFADKMAALTEAQEIALMESVSSPDVMYSIAPAAEAPADMAEGEAITNTQEVGVDEGGIVKNAGDYLVVLRRGRLFTVRTGDGALAPVDAIDAFPPDKMDPGRTWYDEMLISGNQVIVIGYSYGSMGTEINRFDISRDGSLSYRDTHYLRSGDYYSSSNYASRLIDDELILYTPVYAGWGDLQNSLPAIRDYGEEQAQVLVEPQDFLVAEPYRSGRYLLDVLHTVTRCDLSGDDFECSATAIAGTWSRSFYVSREAVYAWTGSAQTGWDRSDRKTPGQLYRIPLDGSRPGAVQVAGSPVDQFSFAEAANEGVLRVLLRSVGNGEGMWASEYSAGEVALATVPFEAFNRGGDALRRDQYRALPEPDGWRFHNRFIGDYLLYAGGRYRAERSSPTLYAVPLDGGEVQEISLPHGVTRLDRLGSDAVVIGPGRKRTLGFSSVSLGSEAAIEDSYMLASANEGETRSQAFFFKPDATSSGGLSGTLGLPVTRRIERPGSEFFGTASAITFLRREERSLSPAGELAATTDEPSNDNCIASCVDWYGNARPIFMDGRIFALMGYEIVEGRMAGGRINEARRISFAPRGDNLAAR